MPFALSLLLPVSEDACKEPKSRFWWIIMAVDGTVSSYSVHLAKWV